MLFGYALNLFPGYYLADYENLFLDRYRSRISYSFVLEYIIIMDKKEFVKEEV